MNKLLKAIILMALLPVCLFAQEKNETASIDSIADYWDKVLELNEVVVVGHRTVLKQESTASFTSPRTMRSPKD